MAQRAQERRVALWLAGGAIGLGILVVVVTALCIHAQGARLRQAAERQLAAVADAQAGAVRGWREMRLAEAAAVFEDLPLARRMQCLAANRDDAEARRDIAATLAALAKRGRHRGAFLVDAQGALLLGGAQGDEPLGDAALGLARQAMRARQVVISDLYREGTSGEPRLDLVIPIRDPCTRDAAPLGAIVLRVDAGAALEALLAPPAGSWSSVWGLLLRREQGGLLILNDLRGQLSSALAVRLPLEDARLPASLVAAQAGGVVEGRGLDGAWVLATLRIIPSSPWYLVVQVDADEALAPLGERARFLKAGAVTLLLALGLVLAMGAVAAACQAARRSERQAAEAERKGLEEMIRCFQAREAGLRQERAADATCLEMAGVPIVVLDGQGRIVRFNWACERLTGYLDEEVLSKPLWEALVPAGEREAARADFAALVAGAGPMRRECLWLARDGRTLRIEWAMNAAVVHGKPQYVIGIGLKASERRQARPRKKRPGL